MALCYVDRNVIVGVTLLYGPSVLSHVDLQDSLRFPDVHVVAVVTGNLVHNPSPLVVLTRNILLLILLLFNALALIHQSDRSNIWQCRCPLVNHTS